MDSLELQQIVTVLQSVFTVIFGVFGWFARRTLSRIETDILKNTEQIEALGKLHVDLSLAKKEMEYIVHEVRSIRSMSEDVAVLKRDQKSIWSRIDELKEKIETISELLMQNNRRGK